MPEGKRSLLADNHEPTLLIPANLGPAPAQAHATVATADARPVEVTTTPDSRADEADSRILPELFGCIPLPNHGLNLSPIRLATVELLHPGEHLVVQDIVIEGQLTEANSLRALLGDEVVVHRHLTHISVAIPLDRLPLRVIVVDGQLVGGIDADNEVGHLSDGLLALRTCQAMDVLIRTAPLTHRCGEVAENAGEESSSSDQSSL